MHRIVGGNRLPITVGLAVLVFAICGAVQAAENKEILQAVKNGVPNTADNRVVLAELFSNED